MKKTKVIIPALGLLLLSTAASVTGTVAWFAANASVTASGMQITAKTNATYLLIGSGENDTAAEIQALGENGLTTALSVSEQQANVLPSAHDSVTTSAAAATVSNWYTGVGTTVSNGTLKNGSKTALTAGNFDKYVIKRTVYLTVATGSIATGAVTITLDLSQINGSGNALTHDPVSVLFACDSSVVEFNEANSWTSASAITTEVVETGVKTIDIYVYYDGNNEDVFTNNFANLSGASIGITFTAAE